MPLPTLILGVVTDAPGIGQDVSPIRDVAFATTDMDDGVVPAGWTPGPSTTLAAVEAPGAVSNRYVLTLTRTGTTGAARAVLTHSAGGVNVQGGRLYVLWVPVRPRSAGPGITQGPARDVTVRWVWTNAGSPLQTFTYTQAEGAGHVDTDGWTWIGLVSRASTGATAYQVIIDVLGCEPGELHEHDGYGITYLGTDLADRLKTRPGETIGRPQAVDLYPAGTASWTFRNHDGYLTPGGSGLPVARRQRVTMLARDADGHLHPLWAGYSTGWYPESKRLGAAKAWGTVEMRAVDAFRHWAREQLPPPYSAHVLRTLAAPALFRLNEPAGSTRAANSGPAGGFATFIVGKGSDGGVSWGAASTLPTLDSGTTADDGSPALALGQDDDTIVLLNAGAVLDMSSAPSARPSPGQAWGLSIWAAQTYSASMVGGPDTILFTHAAGQTPDAPLTGFRITWIASTLQFRIRAGVSVLWDGPLLDEGAPTDDGWGTTYGLIHLAYDPAAGGTWGHLRIGDGNLQADIELPTNPYPWGRPGYAYVGGLYRRSTGSVLWPWRGRVSHVGFHPSLTNDQAAGLRDLGYTGLSGEREYGRLYATADLIRWPKAERQLATSRSVFLARRRADGTSALADAQGYTGAAGAEFRMAATGRILTRGRGHRVGREPRFTFAGPTMSPRATGWRIPADDARLATGKRVTQTGSGLTWVLVDEAASTAAGGTVLGQDLTVDLARPTAAQYRGWWEIAQTSSEAPRIEAALFSVGRSPALARALLCLAPGDLIRLGELPSNAPWPEIDLFVEQIKHYTGATLLEWLVELTLSPAHIRGVHVQFRLDHPTLGRLDAGNPLGF